jgi:CheY-like chemotaxis protein
MCIFDPFFTTKPAPAGGLGLSICLRIISDLGGTLEVESEPGRGSTFAARLPLSSPAGSPPRLRGSSARPLPKRSHVLLIEDEPVIAEVLARLLAQAGHDVQLAASGADGIELYRRGRFDCVISDLVMPGLSGLTVSRAIKDHDPDAHVVLLTGGEDQVDANLSAAAGVDRVMTKPVGYDQLVQIFESDCEDTSPLARETSCARS